MVFVSFENSRESRKNRIAQENISSIGWTYHGLLNFDFGLRTHWPAPSWTNATIFARRSAGSDGHASQTVARSGSFAALTAAPGAALRQESGPTLVFFDLGG